VLARGAPIEQREGMLGHVAEGQAGPYGFWLPLNAQAVRDATERWLQEINAHCKRVDLTDPSSLDRAAEEAKREIGRQISRNRWKK
jgi:NAD(P)-dependent dehydrogenase (short-subunit alcohol dehydrogenase family)